MVSAVNFLNFTLFFSTDSTIEIAGRRARFSQPKPTTLPEVVTSLEDPGLVT
jgi:hypothetical protein